MSYLALYRRFRPVDFESVIGQDTIVKTLTNQIKSDKIGHAYLFCGTRGTGKTTLAKIFARAVNCTASVNGSPCGKCEACKSLADTSQIDIVEMDAASNNKVENIRDIRESVQYPPVKVRYKVYIIDEVHMLTQEAFNALLKTLEEPPKHAIFILATTEPHKIPATILSRCMRFDFRLVSTAEIAKLISGIYDEIGKKYTKEGVMAIAKAGEGSVRDALSVADLCVSIGDGELKYQDVANVLGATDISKTNELVANIFNGNVGGVLSIVEELSSLGKSIGVLVKDVIGYLRDIFVVKTCDNASEILSIPDATFEMEKKTSLLCDEHRILRTLEIISGIENALRFSTQPRSVLETALIKATMPQNDYNIDALISRIDSLEKQLENIKSQGITREVPTKNEEPKKEASIKKEEVKAENKKVVNDDFDLVPPPIEDDLSGLVPPPVEEDFSGVINAPIYKEEIKPINQEVKRQINLDEMQVVEENAPIIDKMPTSSISAQANNNVSGKRVWGSVVRKLRGMPGKTILWVACQEMVAIIDGNSLILTVDGDTERNLITKQENFNCLQALVKEFGNYEIKVMQKDKILGNEKSSEGEVKAFFGDTLKIIK